MASVRMINSVGEYVAGKKYNLKKDEADRFITLGYAEGELSREIPDEEQAELRGDHQVVALGDAVAQGAGIEEQEQPDG